MFISLKPSRLLCLLVLLFPSVVYPQLEHVNVKPKNNSDILGIPSNDRFDFDFAINGQSYSLHNYLTIEHSLEKRTLTSVLFSSDPGGRYDKPARAQNERNHEVYFNITCTGGIDFLGEETRFNSEPFYWFDLGISSLDYISRRYQWQKNGYRIPLAIIAYQSVLCYHELSTIAQLDKFDGMCQKSGPFKGLNIGLFSARANCGTMPYSPRQEVAAYYTAGGDSAYVMSQNIARHSIEKDQLINPITAMFYVFGACDRLRSYTIGGTGTLVSNLSEVENYIRAIEDLYGKDSISPQKLKLFTLLDFCDPVLIASIYSVFSGKDVEIPRVKVSNKFAFTPFIRSVQTPYGANEVRVGSYIFTNYSPIKVSVSYGQQSKTSIAIARDEVEHSLYTLYAGRSLGCFTGLNQDEQIINQTAWSFDLSILKLFSVSQFTFGLDAKVWSQPELFLDDPYRAESKIGCMMMMRSNYTVDENLSIRYYLGAKSKGFVENAPITARILFGLSLQFRLVV